MIHAAGVGVVLTLLAAGDAERDLAVPALTREAVLAAVTTDTPPPGEPTVGAGLGRAVARAVALKAVLPEAFDAFTPAERDLLAEWLDRLRRERWGDAAGHRRADHPGCPVRSVPVGDRAVWPLFRAWRTSWFQ